MYESVEVAAKSPGEVNGRSADGESDPDIPDGLSPRQQVLLKLLSARFEDASPPGIPR